MSEIARLLKRTPYDLVRELEILSAWDRPEKKEFERAFEEATKKVPYLRETDAELYVATKIGLAYLKLLRRRYARNRLAKLALVQRMVGWMQDKGKLEVILQMVEEWPEKKRREEEKWRDWMDAQLID